jgi:L-ornithine Nalpha-acyltransferase
VLRLSVAHGEAQRADADRVRERVYEEEGMKAPSRDPSRCRGDVTELLVYARDEAVGALRLRVGGPKDARDALADLELSSKFNLRGFEGPSVVVSEVSGFCVVRRYRGTRAAALLFAALRAESARRRVTHWVAAANTQTNSAEEADIVHRLLRERGLLDGAYHASSRSAEAPPPSPTRFIYTAEERARARRGELDSLRLPRVLALFAGSMGARYIGRPVFDRDYEVFATPLAVELKRLGAPCR